MGGFSCVEGDHRENVVTSTKFKSGEKTVLGQSIVGEKVERSTWRVILQK